MFRPIGAALAIGAALVAAHPAFAVTDEELTELREQVRQLKEQYERRIEALEQRLRRAELAAGSAQAEAARPQTEVVRATARVVGEDAYNPGISLILNGTYANLSRNPAGFRIGGFVPTLGAVEPPARGLRLAESELVISAGVDPDFRGTLIAALAPGGGVEVEEAHVERIGLANGLNLKAGRFFSSLGNLNQVHAHAWDFADASLAQKAFLAGRLAEEGVQMKWVAPTDIYFDLGVELGRGRSFPGADRSKNGIGAGVIFANIGGDIGASHAWKAGLSYLGTRADNRSYDETDSTGTVVNNSFNGTSRLWVLDGIMKWAPGGNPIERNLKLQGEYFRRIEDGDFTYDTAAASLGTRTGGFASRQSGWVVQGVYQFAPRWRVGYRHDRLDSGSTGIGLVYSGVRTAADFPVLASYGPSRNTLMADWSPSEFSRVRLQFARDRSRRDAIDSQIVVQYVMSMGAHGAHRF